jgi:hypothetical protein
MTILMPITEAFTLNLRAVLEKNNITAEELFIAIRESNVITTKTSLRTLKTYISSAPSSKNINPTIKNLQAITMGLACLGVETSVYELLGGANKHITYSTLLEATKQLVIQNNELHSNDFVIFFKVLNKLGVDNIVSLAQHLSDSDSQ